MVMQHNGSVSGSPRDCSHPFLPNSQMPKAAYKAESPWARHGRKTIVLYTVSSLEYGIPLSQQPFNIWYVVKQSVLISFYHWNTYSRFINLYMG